MCNRTLLACILQTAWRACRPRGPGASQCLVMCIPLSCIWTRSWKRGAVQSHKQILGGIQACVGHDPLTHSACTILDTETSYKRPRQAIGGHSRHLVPPPVTAALRALDAHHMPCGISTRSSAIKLQGHGASIGELVLPGKQADVSTTCLG